MAQWRYLLLAALLTGTAFPVMAQVLPSEARYTHLGVATCASSVCHGKVTRSETDDVWLNEYRVWSRHDEHSNAYSVLRNKESKAMAEKLGLSNAAAAEVCLECHTDHVPPGMRGPKFQIGDGVGCEACHGGAEKWIESHTDEGATHAANLAAGMYPTEKPKARARLCLSCHVGTTEKFANHDIMAAGHPRMSLELQTFTVNQPAHYHVDEDYLQRKGRIDPVTMWVTGQLLKAKRELDLMQSDLFTGHGLFPELAFFDCHACHHSMNDVRWSPTMVIKRLPIGAVRLDDSSLVVLIAVTSVVAPEKSAELERWVSALNEATTQSKARTMAVAAALSAYLDPLAALLDGHEYTSAETRAMRLELLDNARRGEYRDFSSAEQAFLAVETLSIELGEYQDLDKILDAWFEAVKDEHGFNPDRFAAVAGQFWSQLQ